MALEGSERELLHAIVHEQGDAQAGYVEDSKIAHICDLRIEEVRDYLETLEGKGCVERSVGVGGHSAYITAKGRQELRRSPIVGDDRDESTPRRIKVVPKGLRSFDAEDKDFFLELLPGPRRGDGLPESVHFWKVRIEEMDPEKTFKIGIILGPSGCGKSSLVKAGLLPRLADFVIPIYVEATAVNTEAGLLKKLRKKVPNLPTDLTLPESVKALHEVAFDHTKKKIIIFIDQFEQWLHAKRLEANTELGQTLRHCDGNRVQAIVMVRDDFSTALLRFLTKLGVDWHYGQNAALVDLFDHDHALKVLSLFGQGYGKPIVDLSNSTNDQSKFLNEAVSELEEDGKVVSVRLALFAQMVKDKPWKPETLKAIGGIEGVGVTFLEETFSSPQINPKYFLHQRAAQEVLKSLLPEGGTDIKGNAKSYQTLLEASGYATRPEEFDNLLKILDKDVRLIKPTVLRDSTDEDQQSDGSLGEKSYQLTHDYLVPSIREWLTRKQKETRRGRAELLLVDRSSLWNAKPENRHLPSLLEWANIGLLTKKNWTEPQRKMMKRAGRVYGLGAVCTAAMVAVLVALGLNVRERVAESNRSTVAAGLVNQVLKADTAQVRGIVALMKDYRRLIDPALKDALGKADKGSPEELHARLALLPVDAAQVEPLHDRMLTTSPDVATVIRQALEPHCASLVPRLWSVLDSAKPGDESLLPAASALADYDATSQHWESVGGKVAQALVNVNPFFSGPWLDALRPVRTKLTSPLACIFREKNRPESEHALAINILTDYASDDPNLIANLLMDADPKAYASFFPLAQRHETKTLTLFQAEVAKKATIPDGDKDSETVKDRLAERQARAAVALLRMGKAGEIMPFLRHSADPRLRSFIVNWLNPLGAEPRILAAELDRIDSNAKPTPAQGQQFMDSVLFHLETSQRRALILAIGTYGTKGLSPGEREALSVKLLDLYRTDPDSGIHGAAEWTLRQWKQQEKLNELDAELMKLTDWGERRWYVNGQGQTYAVIKGPVEFRMGSPPTEPDRASDEIPHRRSIRRCFAIAVKEVTVEEYQEFVKANPGVDHANNDRYSPDGQKGPMNRVTWYHAAAYCNWLSRRENLPECYEPNDKGKYADGMKIRADALQRTGYRLPTEAEWEYGCRAGAKTSRFYGSSLELLGHYAWYLTNSQVHAWSCGSVLPNELGVFDMLGNMYEWCQEQYYRYPEREGNTTTDDINMLLSIKEQNPRLLRGGSFGNHRAAVRSALRDEVQPSNHSSSYGFRLSRTLPLPPCDY